MNCIDFD
jgi:hypothetical protein